MNNKSLKEIEEEINKALEMKKKLWADFTLTKEVKEMIYKKFKMEKNLRVDATRCPKGFWDIIIYF